MRDHPAAVAHALPHATIVADHFRLVRLANQAVTATCAAGSPGTPTAAAAVRPTRSGRSAAGCCAVGNGCGPTSSRRCWNDLVDDDPTSKILTAWIAKEELRRLLPCARTGGHRHEISARLHRFNAWCADSRLPELGRLAGTIEAWWPEVLGDRWSSSKGQRTATSACAPKGLSTTGLATALVRAPPAVPNKHR